MAARWQKAVGAGVLVAGAAALWLHGGNASSSGPLGASRAEAAATSAGTRSLGSRATAPAALPSAQKPVSEGAIAAQSPRSLQGTDVDDALRVDDRGRLILGPEVIRFFNYFLSATGEESDETIRARILAAIRERLDEPAAGQAEALLGRYLALREASRDMSDRLTQEAEPSARLEVIRRMRREHFTSDEAEALFGAEEQESSVAAAQSEVMRNERLSAEERDAKLDALEAQLPEAAREARAEARRPAEQLAEEEAMRAEGATAAELHKHRVATVGVEAAGRLQALDQERNAWEQRLEAFRQEREKLTRAMGDGDAQTVAVLGLLERSFSPPEQLRVRAMLKMRGEPIEM
ncbi:lipase secretion chaperone [Chondromyces crocatus]|uniref:Lipase helper protein n=1 Tax=Chondromyces crocatus TaxID=52 RepID=A0A0K1ETR7_CHOCO|nr:lipase secretion chaperone [Chondromyces crocatus]AKT44184.1 lipase chaperone [Chondromyces crocatus]